MSVPAHDADSKEIKELLERLHGQIFDFIYSKDDAERTALRVSYIKLLIDRLKFEGLDINDIYQKHNDAINLLFYNKNPNNEILDFLIEQGFNVNVKTSDMQYPLYQACSRGNNSVAQYLLQYKAKFDDTYKNHSAVGEASSYPLFDIKPMEADSRCREFVEQYHLIQQSMLLAHRFSLNGAGYLGKDYFPMLTYTHPTILRNSLCDSFLEISNKDSASVLTQFNKFSLDIKNSQLDQLIKNVSMRLKTSVDPTYESLIADINGGKVCPIGLGTVFPDRGTHHEGIIFYDGMLLRANRGEGSDGRTGLEINLITRPENRDKIIKILAEKNFTDLNANSLHQNLEEELGLKRINLIQMREQRAPTCKWTSEKALFFGVIYCELLNFFKKQGQDDKVAAENALNISKPWYKDFTIQDRYNTVKSTLDMFPGKNIMEMPLLIQEMLLDIFHRSSGKEKYKPIAKMLIERGVGDYYLLNQKFLRALVDGADEKEIMDYIRQGASGNLCAGEYMDTVLYILIDKGYDLAAKVLLEKGTSPNPPDFCRSIINLAIKKENLEMAELLIAKGAEMNEYHIKDLESLRAKKKAAEASKMSDIETEVPSKLMLTQFHETPKSSSEDSIPDQEPPKP